MKMPLENNPSCKWLFINDYKFVLSLFPYVWGWDSQSGDMKMDAFLGAKLLAITSQRTTMLFPSTGKTFQETVKK
jgi:hypothetical protein